MASDLTFLKDFLLPFLVAVAAGAILLLFGSLKWSLKRHLIITVPIVVLSFVLARIVTNDGRTNVILSGTVVDDMTNAPIGQAVFALSDGSQLSDSEDNGNFRINLVGKVTSAQRIRVRVTKNGYRPFDAAVEVPATNFIVRLHHL